MKHRIAIAVLAGLLSTALAVPGEAFGAAPQEQGGEKREKKEGQEPKRETGGPSAPDEARIAHQMPLYPLGTCVISGEELGPDAKSFLVEDRLVRTCCGRCEGKVKAAPADALKKIDAAVVRAQKPGYPMERCAACAEKLGETPVDHVHGTRLVRLCNEKCVAAFAKEPEAGLKKLDTAYIASQKKGYPLANCIVMGEDPLGDDAVDMLWGNRLVRFCCKKCIKEFRADPKKYLAKLDEAAKPKKE